MITTANVSSVCRVETDLHPQIVRDGSPSKSLSVVKRLTPPTFGTEKSKDDDLRETGVNSARYHTMSPTNDKPQPSQFRAVSSQRDYTASPTNNKPDMIVVMSKTEEPSFALCVSSACLVKSHLYPPSEMDVSSPIHTSECSQTP